MKNALTTLFESSESRVSIHQAEVSVKIYTTDNTLSFKSRGKTYSFVIGIYKVFTRVQESVLKDICSQVCYRCGILYSLVKIISLKTHIETINALSILKLKYEVL